MDKAQFRKEPRPRLTPSDISRGVDAWVKKHPNEQRRVLLCFTTDPYQPCEQETKLTRVAIEILHFYGLFVTILTKGGERAERDFDLLGPCDELAVTLTCLELKKSLRWEPAAAPPAARIASLLRAHQRGIPTWVSLEPVISPMDAKTLIIRTMPWVGHYKVGTMNYHPHAKTVNWHDFGWEIKTLMDKMQVKYYLKKDLRDAMGSAA